MKKILLAAVISLIVFASCDTSPQFATYYVQFTNIKTGTTVDGCIVLSNGYQRGEYRRLNDSTAVTIVAKM